MEMDYMEEHLPASGQPSWHILQTPQFRSYRLFHLVVLCVHHRDCNRLIQLWRSRAQRAHFGHFRLYTDMEQDAADDSFDRILVDGQHFAFDSQEWRPPWPPARLWFQVPWCLECTKFQGGWSRRGEAMGRRYEIWRCEFEKFVCLKQRWCELLEAEAEEERKSSCSAKEDQPPAPREPVVFGSFERNVQEKVCKREEETEGRTGDVVGRPWVAQFREEREKVVDAAAATWRSTTQANVEGLFSGADGAGVHGEGLAWGI